MYPEYAEINGKEYKIDTDFKTALKCFEIVDNDEITDYERAMAIVYLLFDFIPKNKDLNLFLNKAKIFLECGREEKNKSKKEKDMDFIQDRSLINASFMSTYHIDLSKENLHFWQFIEYLEGLTEDSVLNKVREIRNYDLSEIKDPKERKKMKEAKEQVALKKKAKKMTKEQEKSKNDFMKQLGLV